MSRGFVQLIVLVLISLVKGCVLLSHWLPDEIDEHSSSVLFQEFNKQFGTVDFTYSSVKVGVEVDKYRISVYYPPS